MIGKQVLPRGNTAVLLLALLFGVLSAVLIYVYLNATGGDKGAGPASAAMRTVVVAKENIAVGAEITDTMLELREVPVALVVPDAFSNVEGVAGRVALYPIAAGEQVLRRNFAAGVIEDPALAEVVPRDQRGVSIRVAEVTASGGLIRPGDRVDVLLAFQDASAITLLQDVEVLAIAQNVAPKVAPAEEGESGQERQVLGEGSAEADASSATLAVTPQQAQVLVASEEFSQGGEVKLSDALKATLSLPEDEDSVSCQGSIRLVLRPQAQTGPTTVTPKGVCAAIFLSVWEGSGLE